MQLAKPHLDVGLFCRNVEAQLETLTRLEALSFVRHLTENFTPGGVAVRVRALRAGWSWMLAEEMVEANVFARIKVSVPDVARTTADDGQIEAMLASAKPNRRDHAILAVLVDTGCRRGDRRVRDRARRPDLGRGAVPDLQEPCPNGPAQ